MLKKVRDYLTKRLIRRKLRRLWEKLKAKIEDFMRD